MNVPCRACDGDRDFGGSPKYLDDVDETFIKSIEEAVHPAVKRSIAKMRKYYTTGRKK